jgi:hypothetical protein
MLGYSKNIVKRGKAIWAKNFVNLLDKEKRVF